MNEGVKENHTYTISSIPPSEHTRSKMVGPLQLDYICKYFEISSLKGKDNLRNTTGHFH